MSQSIGVAIIGGTGYGAGELLRLFSSHPQISVVSVVSSSQAGEPVTQAHPHLRGFYNLKFSSEVDWLKLSEFKNRAVFLALPHGTSAQTTTKILPKLEQYGCYLIDLSGDYRISDPRTRDLFYPEAGADQELQSRFAYGLTETNREQILKAKFISIPGCLAAACILAAAPLARQNYTGLIVFDAKTGTSGGGKTPKELFHHPSRHGGLTAYKVLEHRHEPEIAQALGEPQNGRIRTMFVPHLVPTSRGIFVTAYLETKNGETREELYKLYRSFYESCKFIRIGETPPEIQAVVGTNFCDISLALRDDKLVVMTALDNLVKGTAGQAIQNLNLVFGLPETTGLWTPALGPC